MVHALNFTLSAFIPAVDLAKRQRQLEAVKKLSPGFRYYLKPSIDGAVLHGYCADHAVDGTHDQLVRIGLPFKWTGAGTPLPEDVDFEAHGRGIWEDAYLRGELIEPEPQLHPYQAEAVGFADFVPRAIFNHCTGSGKTREALVFALARKGAILWVSTVGALTTQAREIEKLSTLEPHIWKSPSRRRKGYESTVDYLKRMTKEGKRALILCGYQNLVQAFNDIERISFTTIVVDEIHNAKSKKRWMAEIAEDGSVSFEMRENVTALTAYFASKCSRRLGLTATMVPNRTEDVHGIVTIVDPKAWGSFYDWAFRYCAARAGYGGSIDTTGSSHIDELQRRLEYIVHYVTKDQVRDYMPQIRRQIQYITQDELVAPETGWKTELKRASRGGDSSEIADAQAALTAGRKRGRLVADIIELLRDGNKVLCFGGFRKDVEALAEAVESARARKGIDALVTWTHGEHEAGPGGEREQRIFSYMDAPGAALLVGTVETIGESLNLQMTDYLIWAKLPVTPRWLVQGDGRVERLGRDEDVIIWYYVALGTVDERLNALLLEKLPAVGALSKDGTLATVVDVLRGADRYDSYLEGLVADLGDGTVEWSIEED